MNYTKFVSDNLKDLLWKEYIQIRDYVEAMRNHTNDSKIKAIMSHFEGIPADPFRRLIGYITFRKVLVLIYEGKLGDALTLTLRFEGNFIYMWDNHELDIIRKGRLLAM